MFELENFSYIKRVEPFEWVMLGIYMLLIIGVTFYIQVTNVKKDLYYKYYGWAVLAKVLSAIAFCLIYIYYYNGGDTVSYYESSRALVNMAMKNPGNYIKEISQSASMANYLLFDNQTGYPWSYMYFDSNTWFVAKMLSPILFISFKSYLVSTVLLSWLSFFGTWKLFKMICRYYPSHEKMMAICFLFIPSVLFWGSGILKDTFTYSSVCWFIIGLDAFFITKAKRIQGILILIIATYFLVSIKPYILISLVPGAIVWVLFLRISRMNSKLFKYFSIPLIYFFSFAIGYYVLSLFGDRLGKFSIDKMLTTASVTQNDLHQDYYHGSSFDIGKFDPTIQGVLSKAPAAITVGLFRPFLWEARNAVMIISGIENTIYLWLTLTLLGRALVDPKRFFNIILENPFLIFLLSYTILFSLTVGLSTSNFGALVRFKIPFLPSYICAILLLNYFLAGKTDQKSTRIRNVTTKMPDEIAEPTTAFP
jgi:hypothetical protein